MSKNTSKKIQVYIWLQDIDHKKVVAEVNKNTGTSKASLMSDDKIYNKTINVNNSVDFKEYLSSSEPIRKEQKAKVENYVKSKRELSKQQYHKNNRVIDNYINNEDIVFKSKYSPMIIAYINYKKAINFSNLINVRSISKYHDFTVENFATSSIATVDGYFTRDFYGLDGTNVSVGIYEPQGKPAPIDELRYRRITNICDFPAPESSHATWVTSILAGTNGMVPNALFYVNCDDPSIPNSFYSEIEALLDRNVDVINFSGGVKYGDNDQRLYNDVTYWFDHISHCHDVTMVLSSGNTDYNPTDPYYQYLCSSSLSMNSIVVGGIYDKKTWRLEDNIFDSFSTYKERSSSYPNRPDVVAPSINITAGGVNSSGTSAAAPIVTGLVAQLIQLRPSLALNPRQIKSIIMASAHNINDKNYTKTDYDKIGAGLIDCTEAYDLVINNRYFDCYIQGQYIPSIDPVYSKQVYLSEVSATVKVVAAWNLETYHSINGTVEHDNFQDIDLKVYDPNGRLVANSSSSYNNNEIAVFKLDKTTKGYYTIQIRRFNYDTSTSGDRVAIAYNIIK